LAEAHRILPQTLYVKRLRTSWAFIAWIVSAPPEPVLDDFVVTPLDEHGYR
jgi:hypothetical protein